MANGGLTLWPWRTGRRMGTSRRRASTGREAETEETRVALNGWGRGRGRKNTIAVRARGVEGSLLSLALVDVRALRLRLR